MGRCLHFWLVKQNCGLIKTGLAQGIEWHLVNMHWKNILLICKITKTRNGSTNKFNLWACKQDILNLYRYFLIILMFNKSKLNYFSVFCETILLLHVCKKLNNNIECPFFIVSLILINIYVKYFFMFTIFFRM